MILKYFNASEAADFGVALADQYAARSGSKSSRELQEILARADRDVRPLRLNFFKKAKFANSFKWRLLEKGIEPQLANEVTQSLILHLAQSALDPVPDGPGQTLPAGKPSAQKLVDLFARAGKSYDKGDYAGAVALYNEVIALSPNYADAHNNLGIAQFSLGRYQEAERCYRRAIEINPQFVEAICNLADVLQGNPQEAEECLRRALQINPKLVEPRVKLGIALLSSGRERDAKAAFKKVLKSVPNHADALLGLGQIARAEGRFAEAETAIKRSLQSKPNSPGAWAALQGLRKMTAADGETLKKAEEIAGSGISLWEESALRFAIGKHYDDIENYDLAFQNYRRANELLKSVSEKYNRQAHGAFADDMILGHSRRALSAFGKGGSESIKPIFVVGMPRSGTSLTEQIIASHPAAKGIGEPEFWLNAARGNHVELRRGVVGEATRRKLADEYLRFLERRFPEAPRVVDKTPINSDYLGLIHSVFPNARVIRMRRDPIDTGLSIYFQNFSTAMRYSMDLSDIAEFYRVHQRLMDHWCAALPAGTILEVPYEQLVSDQEGWTRKILDFVKLEWDPRCLSFHETQRAVSSASAWQVRQKIYTRSVQRWRNYEKFIGPLRSLKDS